jgi:hypothetical protein
MKGMGGLLRRCVWLVAALGGVLGAGPDAREIVRQSVLNDESPAAESAGDYSFTEHLRTSNLDGDGRVRSVTVRDREMHLADFQRRREKFSKALREIPDAFIFRLAGEETLNSRPAFVIEATPRPGYQPVDRFSRLYTQVRGKLWIDRADFRWLKIEAELLDTVTFGWILVRIHAGSRVSLTQLRLDGGVWAPEQVWYRVSMRVGLLKVFGTESEAKYGEYRQGGLGPQP